MCRHFPSYILLAVCNRNVERSNNSPKWTIKEHSKSSFDLYLLVCYECYVSSRLRWRICLKGSDLFTLIQSACTLSFQDLPRKAFVNLPRHNSLLWWNCRDDTHWRLFLVIHKTQLDIYAVQADLSKVDQSHLGSVGVVLLCACNMS